MDPKARPKRTLFRYSLRTLLIVVTIASAGFGWIGLKVRQGQRQRDAVQSLREAGAEVEYDYQMDSGFNRIHDASPPGPAWLRRLVGDDVFANVALVHVIEGSSASFTDAECLQLEGFSKLRFLGLANSQITDIGLAHLKGLTELEMLSVRGPVTDAGLLHLQGMSKLKFLFFFNTRITDAGLSQLRGLPKLEHLGLTHARITDSGCLHFREWSQLCSLDLSNIQITDAGLIHLQGLTKLDYLNISSTAITDAGLAHLQGLTRLEDLNVANTRITDAGLMRLRELSNLKSLYINGTRCTNKGCRKLQSVLPNLKDVTLFIEERWPEGRDEPWPD